MTNSITNYLPAQNAATGGHPINHNYLKQQFAEHREIFAEFEKLLENTDFTLGKAVDRFEASVCELTGAAACIGVGNGTDALFLSLKALGLKPGDEVITTPHTFFATVGAIVTAGGRPVFADIGPDMNLDPARVAQAVTPRTRVILPVHWAGLPCDMDALQAIADEHGLDIVEDACHALCATYKGRPAGRFGATGCFSMHPLKNLNVWGDGGFVLTDRPELRERLMLLRNHGLVNRDTCQMWAYNSRLDTLQAIVANQQLATVPAVTAGRQRNAAYLDGLLAGIAELTVPERPADRTHVFHLYSLRAQRRDALVAHLNAHGIDAKVHYPVPMHLQPAAAEYGYKRGDFPEAEALAESTISLPVHQFLGEAEMDVMARSIKDFYAG